jgi:CubicO group peptidase (beta-lactamase class C family)
MAMTPGKHHHVNRSAVALNLAIITLLGAAASLVEARTYPQRTWQTRTPEQVGLDRQKVDAIAGLLGGRGCIVRNGYVVKSWADQSQKGGWMSSSKPVISTLLFFALQEGKLDSVHTPIKRFGWDLSAKDRTMTFHHLANMISGYARPDKPGAAWAYNDYAINLYRLTLFDRLFKAGPEEVANDPKRLGALQFEDGLSFSKKAHVVASVRDFARLCWFWLNGGEWQGKVGLYDDFFMTYCRPQVPADLPHTQKADTDDYLGIGSYGGGSDHFTKAGPGIYGYNFWFNGTGRDHPDELTWPDAPAHTFMTIGAGGNSAAIIPNLDMVIVAAKAKWGNPMPGDRKSVMNRAMKLAVEAAARTYKVSGELKKWHPVTIDFEGPETNEMSTDPNPFLDYRLQVYFRSPRGKTCIVPGFYAGNGKGGGSGNVWRVRFAPDEAGRWSFRTTFRKGPEVAISFHSGAGEPAAFDNCTGTFVVGPRDEDAPGLVKLGRLEYAGGYYLKFRDGPYWIKGGADSPEDFLSYEGFDNTRSGSEFRVKTYADHIRHWRSGDPDWGDGKGKGIIGAINYLAQENINLIYFLPMNIGGDGRNVWPFAGKINPNGHVSNDNLHYDISKLDQWEIVFGHAQRKGIVLHFVFNEAERKNKTELGTDLTTERKLFYREMVARFGHHNAILWNLCEEYNLNINLGPENVRAFARYVQETDPYDHPITVHHSSDPVVMLKPFLGDELFSITSIQIGRKDIEPVVENFRELTRKAGRPIPIAVDEFTVTTHDKPWLPDDDIAALRIEKLWPAYLSGGQVEFIVGDLLKTENFTKYEDLWRYTWHARKFVERNLPFWEMEPADDLLEGESVYKGKTSTHDGQVFAKPGQCYALYFPSARKTGTLDLTAARGRYHKRWYNPRTGRFAGPVAPISGGGRITIGPAPEDPEKDWALLLKRILDRSVESQK